MWLTIPVEKKNYFKQIREIPLPEDRKWLKKHKLSIVANYSRCRYFDGSFVDEYYSDHGKYTYLQEFNESGIFYLKKRFGIPTEIVRASELDLRPDLRSTELLMAILETLGGSTYISGPGGKNYIDEDRFLLKGVSLEYFEFKPYLYPQRWDGFEPYMSALDLVFNLDSEAFLRDMTRPGCLELNC